MPLNFDCSSYEFSGLFTRDLASKGWINIPISQGVLASRGNDPNPNLLKGFIPPGEIGMASLRD